MNLNITIMSGAGNIFSVIDGSKHNLSLDDYKLLAVKVCLPNSYYQNKTEGLIVVNHSFGKDDFSVLFFNPDGSYGAMCGNGARCAVHFAIENNIVDKKNKDTITFLMQSKEYKCVITEMQYRVYFPPPNKISSSVAIDVEGRLFSGDFIDVGSDHYVIDFDSYFTDDFFDFDINSFSPKIRYHDNFAPAGVNVNYYKIVYGKIYLRTYERGVESETGACGTGAISTALSLYINKKLNFPIEIIPTSRIPLIIDAQVDPNSRIMGLSLQGNAEIIMNYNIEI